MTLYRAEALERVAYRCRNGRVEYFDELMFMYKEDADLSYRLQLAGYSCRYTPDAIAFHDRTTRKVGSGFKGIWATRKSGGAQNRAHSFANHLILVTRYFTQHSLRVKMWTLWRETMHIGFVFLCEWSTVRASCLLWHKRKILQEKKNHVTAMYTRRDYMRLEDRCMKKQKSTMR